MTADTFCVNPWVSLHVAQGKFYNPCCLFKKQFPAASIHDYTASSELAQVKRDLIAGVHIKECSTCWQQEQQGYASKRQRDNTKYQKVFQAKHQNNLEAVHTGFIEYYVRLGNHCNIKCVTCNDELSTGWLSENKKFNLPYGQAILLEETHEIWQHLRDNAAGIGAIEFIGGEPFMMSTTEQCSLFQFLIESGHSKHIRIKYNTNGTRMPTEQIDLWPHFRAVEINLSADGVGDRFDYMRFPAKWDEVQHNIDIYKQLQQTSVPQLELTVIHTVSVLNIGYVDEIIDYCNNADIRLFINMLENPSILNIFNADSRVKDWVASRINQIEHPVVNTLLHQLHVHPSKTNSIDILAFARALDVKRGVSVDSTFPELVAVLND